MSAFNALTLNCFAKLTAKHIFFHDEDRDSSLSKQTVEQTIHDIFAKAAPQSPRRDYLRDICANIHLTEFIYISPQNAISRCERIENNKKREREKGKRERSDRKIYQRERNRIVTIAKIVSL